MEDRGSRIDNRVSISIFHPQSSILGFLSSILYLRSSILLHFTCEYPRKSPHSFAPPASPTSRPPIPLGNHWSFRSALSSTAKSSSHRLTKSPSEFLRISLNGCGTSTKILRCRW